MGLQRVSAERIAPAPWEADVGEDTRSIIAAAIDSQEAHVPFDRAVADLPEDLRGRRPADYPHSPWELLEHVRVAQADLLAFMEDPGYAAPRWPDDYWPQSPEPPSPAAWNEAVVAVRRDRERLRAIAMQTDDLSSAIPWGGGKTYLRTLLLAADHAAYHVGQIVAVRRMLGAWPSAQRR
jgi:uncharacterized damage-inducible protein DinB